MQISTLSSQNLWKSAVVEKKGFSTPLVITLETIPFFEATPASGENIGKGNSETFVPKAC